MDKETPTTVPERRTILEFLESHSDAALRMQSLDWVLDHLARLREQTQNACAAFRVAEADLEATERLWQLAVTHDDAGEARWQRYETQYERLWWGLGLMVHRRRAMR